MENKFCAEYIWIGGENELRSKTRVFTNYNKDDGFPDWDYDGSSTKQADGTIPKLYCARAPCLLTHLGGRMMC
jgi:hypothetical protein